MSKSLVQNSRIIAKKGHLNGREVLAFFAVVEGIEGYSVKLVDFRYTDKARSFRCRKPRQKMLQLFPSEALTLNLLKI